MKLDTLTLAALAALSAGACARPWMRDESARIEETMRCEAFSHTTPGAEGIALGEDAPPLAPPFAEAPAYLYGGRHRGLGMGSGLGIGRGR